jgi:hypothetical protein
MTNLPSYLTVNECKANPEHRWSGRDECPFCAGLRAVPAKPNSFTREEYREWEKRLGIKDDDWNMPFSEGGWEFRRQKEEERRMREGQPEIGEGLDG